MNKVISRRAERSADETQLLDGYMRLVYMTPTNSVTPLDAMSCYEP